MGAEVNLAEVVAVLADEVDLGEVGADEVELEAVQEAQDDQAEVGEDAVEVVAVLAAEVDLAEVGADAESDVEPPRTWGPSQLPVRMKCKGTER